MPATHADAIAKFVDTLLHLSKAKLTMDSAAEGLFGNEYANTVATGRGLINDNLHTLAMGIVHVLDNEQEERAQGVQSSLVGATSDEILQEREKRQKKDKGPKKERSAKKDARDPGDVPLRPIFEVYRFKPADEIYVARFYPTETGRELTGFAGPWDGYDPTSELSLDEQVAVLPTLKYDANPEVLDWFKNDAGDFEAIAGMAYPAAPEPAPAAPAEDAPKEEPAEVVGATH